MQQCIIGFVKLGWTRPGKVVPLLASPDSAPEPQNSSRQGSVPGAMNGVSKTSTLQSSRDGAQRVGSCFWLQRWSSEGRKLFLAPEMELRG
jgi:hypothetical protein